VVVAWAFCLGEGVGAMKITTEDAYLALRRCLDDDPTLSEAYYKISAENSETGQTRCFVASRSARGGMWVAESGSWM
jgi:hypothetical protein